MENNDKTNEQKANEYVEEKRKVVALFFFWPLLVSILIIVASIFTPIWFTWRLGWQLFFTGVGLFILTCLFYSWTKDILRSIAKDKYPHVKQRKSFEQRINEMIDEKSNEA